MFPVSDKSSDVIKALSKTLERLGAEVHLHSEVRDLLMEEGRCRGILLKKAAQRLRCTGMR